MKDNIMSVNYHRTGNSTNTNSLGMREMQAKVYKKRNSKYLLVKAPPASGKSRALMFVGLYKLNNQGIKKIIVAVPERAIGKSFKSTRLSKNGFYYDWNINPYYDLTTFGGTDRSITNRFLEFLADPKSKILLCTHSTLRNAYNDIDDDARFDDIMIAIDEFHHVAAEDSSLGDVVKNIIHNSTANILAMTGSYFRGDSQPILTEEDQKLFDEVDYTYYEQLDGYKYLKSFGIDYKFYQGTYLDAIDKALDTNKKTIIHIPNVNSADSTKDKERELGYIEDTIGEFLEKDPKTGIDYIKRQSDGKILKVADLITEEHRDRVQNYLRNLSNENDLDIIIALGLAKEGFDWPWAENALTIGYRGSLTEIVQIIGRVTRDSPNKNHAEFTNLIAKPDANDTDVTVAVNTIIKAITSSLLMEQVLEPRLKFKSNNNANRNKNHNDGHIIINGFKEPSTDKTKNIINHDLPELKAAILQDKEIQNAIATKANSDIINKDLIPKVIREQNPDLSTEELEEVRQYTIADMALKQSKSEESEDSSGNSQQFLHMADKIINVDELDINLIDSINPFQRAYKIISNNIDSSTLRIIQQSIDSKKADFSESELISLYPRICDFVKNNNGQLPNKHSSDELEVRYAYALSKLRDMKLRQMNGE